LLATVFAVRDLTTNTILLYVVWKVKMRDKQGFAPIDSYGVIGDRRSAALVAHDGYIDWLCWPHFDSPSIFAAMLDPEKGGYFRVGPVDGGSGHMRYDGETNILLTQFITDKGEMNLGDAMTRPEDRPEGDPEGHEHRELLRRIDCTRGMVEVKVECVPRFYYGRMMPKVEQTDSGVSFHGVDGGRSLRLQVISPRGKLETADDRAVALLSLNAGETAWVSLRLEPQEGRRVGLLTECDVKLGWENARHYWERWVAGGKYPSEHRDIAVRSALITQLLRYAENGAPIAAPTTSLPEIVGRRRNYDYRYSWVRDGSLGLAVLSILGYLDEAKQSMEWLSSLGSDVETPLQVVYTVRGETRIDQYELDHLRGYRDTKPVRIGNHAWNQVQPDELGILLDCILIYKNQGGDMLPEFWDLVDRTAEYVYSHWEEPNNGIWENIERKIYVSSLILCWVALDRAIELAKGKKGWEDKAKKWRQRAKELKEYTVEYGFDEAVGSFTYTIEDKRLDAAVLTAITFSMFSADDQINRSTMRRIREQLSRGDMLLRHLLAEEAEHVGDGMPAQGWKPVEKRDNPFHPCTLWLAQSYALAGEICTAESILNWVWSHASPLGLLSEEYAPDVGEARGNYPLIFSHMELLKAVFFIQKMKKKQVAKKAA